MLSASFLTLYFRPYSLIGFSPNAKKNLMPFKNTIKRLVFFREFPISIIY